ncbi:MAG: LpqB family beta-propeller domain-containing protein [Dehalococcoidia bacterium]
MPRITASSITVLALVFGVLLLASPSQASIPGANGDIAFGSGRDGDAAIFRMHSDGSNQVKLADSSNVDFGPAWSPDGTKIAFTSERDGNREIYVMNADGTDQTRLTNSASEDFEPTWTPDGETIAFRSSMAGGDAWTVSPDGSDLTPLDLGGLHARVLDYSPDGTKLVFISDDNDIVSVYVANADGSNPHQLANSNQHEDDPSWSPDGTKIAFIRAVSIARAPSGLGGPTDLIVINADGTGEVNLTSDALYDSEPAWSPDGTKIAFYSERDEGDGIYLMNPDGTGKQILLADAYAPAWQTLPAGSRLWGDGDCSGEVNPVDSLKTLRHDAGLNVDSVTGCPELGSDVDADNDPRLWGDVDCSGAVNPIDSLKLLRYDGGLPVDQSPDCPSIGVSMVVVLTPALLLVRYFRAKHDQTRGS